MSGHGDEKSGAPEQAGPGATRKRVSGGDALTRTPPGLPAGWSRAIGSINFAEG